MLNKLNKKIIVILFLIFAVALAFYIYKKRSVTKPNPPAQTQTESPKIISTKPDPLDNSVISATDVVEISFNRPLQNTGEFKVRIEPKKDYKIELSSDRKTAKIIPGKPYDLGTTYTLFIGPETKFDEVGRWGEEKIFHFRTIKYKGV